MKLKLVVVDLELSRKQKHALAAVVALMVSIGGAAIAFAGQKTFVSGDTLTATDLNGNFTEINSRLDGLSTGLTQGCPGSSAIKSVDAQGVVVCTPANDIVGIKATVIGPGPAPAGFTMTPASCPTGYKLVSGAICGDSRTNAGVNGWDNGGTVGCTVTANTLSASLGNYGPGSAQTEIDCCGVCAKQ